MRGLPRFYVGLHIPAQSGRFDRAFISINKARGRRKPVPCREWILDSGAFTEIAMHGGYRDEPEVYGAEVERLAAINPGLVAAVSQDFMCEPFMLERTGLSIATHQALTIERFDRLRACVSRVQLIPVLQGYAPADYAAHVLAYGDRLEPGAWVGVGSVCKRNTSPAAIEAVLRAVLEVRPDLRLHGFGIKLTALGSGLVRALLYSADSMAWSHSAASKCGLLVRQLGRELGRQVKPSEARAILARRGIRVPDANDPGEAEAWLRRIVHQPVQEAMPI